MLIVRLAVPAALMLIAALGVQPAQAESLSPKPCVPDSGAVSGVSRTAGADRFEVSANLSMNNFFPYVDEVFIASGLNFADALSGSAVAGYRQAPMLLVGGGSEAPAVIRSELSRLKPKKIIVVGGPASVSVELEHGLSQFAPSVVRVSGADRYEVSANLASLGYGTGTETIYVASGDVFPDALSAAAAAGDEPGPVVLVQRDAIPPAVEQYLRHDASLTQIVMIGGPSTISSSVALQLSRFARVQGIPGADRFAVSAATSANHFCADRSMVFIASGEVFPDALSGSAVAIQWGSPVLLVSKNDISFQVEQELRRLNPQHITVLGGENTISKSLEEKLANYLRK
ncbi:cell wall-binding repeat-containing protein [Herbiconiux sp. YIM B11900]|uniref:cell wall-binding repeat-containing protein n=1 Tax=Herbiconiux sp. YIM B11900 TaxID=3404131 RepID=UPI003F860914